MAKLTLDDVGSGYLTGIKYNENNDRIETALENTLSRDGTDPNNMLADLDMDSKEIINLGAPSSGTSAARWVDVTDAVNLTGTAVPALTGNSQKYLGNDGASLGWKNFYDQSSAESIAGVTPTDYRYPWGDVRRYGVTGSGDEQAAYQRALNCGEKVIDGKGIAATVNSSLTIPAGVELRNANITAGASGINLLLVNTGCKVYGKFIGSGATNVTERLIYPAAQGVTDVYLDVEVTNATYGVHLQPTSGTAVANRPKRWKGVITANGIVGATGIGEGYALLMSPAEQCEFTLHAKSIARHALYLSAGSRYNKITAHIDECDNYAVQLYSTSGQDATEQNEVTIFAQNLGENVAGQGGAIAIVQKAHRNVVRVFHDGDGTTTYSVSVEGQSGGPYPTGNSIIDGKITGQFIGTDVIRMLNADGTIVRGNRLEAYATTSVIGMRRSGTNGSAHGGYVEGNFIDAQGQNIKGIYDEVNSQPSHIGINEVTNNSTGIRVDDQTSGNRTGFSRIVGFTGTTSSITAGATGDTSASIARDVSTTRRSVTLRITDSSVDATGLIRRIGTPADSTHVDFRILNQGASSQTFTYEGVVSGD